MTDYTFPRLTERQRDALRRLPPFAPRRVAEARRLPSYEKAVDFYVRQKIKDTGQPPNEWPESQVLEFHALMDLWRSVRGGTAEDSIRELAAKYGVAVPLTGEGFALLAVRLAGRLGEPGFEQEPQSQGTGKPLLHAWICTLMADATADGTSERNAAREVQHRLKAAGHKMSAKSIMTRFHEQKRALAATNEATARELGKNSIDGGLEPRDALAVAVASAPPLTTMERAALAMVDPSRKMLAPWALQNEP